MGYHGTGREEGNGLLAPCKDCVKREDSMAGILRGEKAELVSNEPLGPAAASLSAPLTCATFSILQKRRRHASIGAFDPRRLRKKTNLWSA
jgi:hypothetical protein